MRTVYSSKHNIVLLDEETEVACPYQIMHFNDVMTNPNCSISCAAFGFRLDDNADGCVAVCNVGKFDIGKWKSGKESKNEKEILSNPS